MELRGRKKERVQVIEKAYQRSQPCCRGYLVKYINNLSFFFHSPPPTLYFCPLLHPSSSGCFSDSELRGFYHSSPRGTDSSLKSLILITPGPVILIFEIYCCRTPLQRSQAPVSPSWQSFVKRSPLLTRDTPIYLQTHARTLVHKQVQRVQQRTNNCSCHIHSLMYRLTYPRNWSQICLMGIK